jgi:hypothetical protein
MGSGPDLTVVSRAGLKRESPARSWAVMLVVPLASAQARQAVLAK